MPEPSSQVREQALLQRMPASQREGAFPRSLLTPSERVVFETRPALSSYLTVPLLVTVPWSLLVGWGVAATAHSDTGGPAIVLAALLILAGPFWLWVVLAYLNWKGTAYALTGERVIRRSGRGGRTLQDARYDLVQRVDLSGNTVRFHFMPMAGAGNAAHGGGLLGRQVNWPHVQEAAQVQVFAQEFVSIYAQRVREQHYLQMLRAQAHANKIKCNYCGTLMELHAIRLDRPKCGSCGAPLVALT